MNLVDEITRLRKGERIVFSSLSGYNYYSIPLSVEENTVIPVALHRESDILYKMWPGEILDSQMTGEQMKRIRSVVLEPVSTIQFEWPVDVVEIVCNSGRKQLFYVFPSRAMLGLEPLKKLLYVEKQNDTLDWRQTHIQQVSRSFLQAMDALHKAGYSYNDFNVQRMMYNPKNGQVYLCYTTGIRKRYCEIETFCTQKGSFSIEFEPPSSNMDRDLYAVAAILFRMMIGRLPYQGWSLEKFAHVFDHNYYDLDKQDAYQNYFQEYHKCKCFVFDPDDDSNPLSPASDDDLPRERWEKLPEQIRSMFIQSLACTGGRQRRKMRLYTPREWIGALEQCCWKKDEGDMK